ncbi:hypothetical protein [Georgenia yuyongxinii]|uniref:Uncharacterized protein n=1 Tax=Georgenia yuyongxinii TaxID=2589797 RepID=A0A552WVY2_9MICO|nr:hypothetical protein [Georgenia yuyongxinii]TRW46885.1 hypothetical protein FJ693_04030 [Georgenia yuyongxinii]
MTFHAVRFPDGALGVLDLSDEWPRAPHGCAGCARTGAGLRHIAQGAAVDAAVLLCGDCDPLRPTN